jgi:hypothetical protein
MPRFNSSQTIDMVAHLQSDVRRLRRQIQQKDRTVDGKAYDPSSPTDAQNYAGYDPYSVPMKRFLARTASVASRASTSTTLMDLDAIYTQEVFDISQSTVYSGLNAQDHQYYGESAEYYSGAKMEKGPLDPVPKEIISDPLPVVTEELPIGGTPKLSPKLKSSSWKNMFRKKETKPTDSNTRSMSETSPSLDKALDSTAQQQDLRPVLSESDMVKSPPTFSQSPPAVSTDSSSYFEDHSHQTGVNLTKSMTTPIIPQHHSQRDIPPLPIRSISGPGATSYGNLEAHKSERPTQNPYAITHASVEKLPPANSDRENLLSSLRKPTPEQAPTKFTTAPDTPCRGCQKPVQQDQHFRLDDKAWHTQCFRCSSCNVRLQSDNTPPFLLKDDYLVCSNCSLNCQKCDQRVEEHGAKDEHSDTLSRLHTLTSNAFACPGLFFCHECHKSIKNLRYVRTKQGIFCMGCQNPIMSEFEKSRRDAERENAKPVPILVG